MFAWIERLLGNKVIQESSGSVDRRLNRAMDRAMLLLKTGEWEVKKGLQVYCNPFSMGYRVVLRRKKELPAPRSIEPGLR